MNKRPRGSCTSMIDGWMDIHVCVSDKILALYVVSILVSVIHFEEFSSLVRSSKVDSSKQDCRHSMIVCGVCPRAPSPKDRHTTNDSWAYSDASLDIDASLYIGLLGLGTFAPHAIEAPHRDVSLSP
jgi:hypothetical protein